MLLLLHHPLLFKENQRKLKTQQEGFLAPLSGRSSLKSRHTKYPSQTHLPHIYIICHLPFVFLSPTSPLPFYSPSLSQSPLSFTFLFVCLCVGLLVEMAQDNTKLCDFSNTNNNDFLRTPVAPLNDVESCELNAALLNLVMKDQFSAFLVKMSLLI